MVRCRIQTQREILRKFECYWRDLDHYLLVESSSPGVIARPTPNNCPVRRKDFT